MYFAIDKNITTCFHGHRFIRRVLLGPGNILDKNELTQTNTNKHNPLYSDTVPEATEELIRWRFRAKNYHLSI